MLTVLAIAITAATATPDTAMMELKLTAPGLRAHHAQDGRLDRLYGDVLSTGRTATDSASMFVAAHADVWGVKATDLVSDSKAVGLMFDPSTGTPRFTRVLFTQHHAGVQVFDASLRLLIGNTSDHELVLAAADLRSLGDWAPTSVPSIQSRETLIARAALHMLGPRALIEEAAQLVVFAGTGTDAMPPRLAIVFTATRGQSGEADYAKHRLVIDATSGGVLYDEDRILHCSPSPSHIAAMALTDISGVVEARVNDGWSAWECDVTVTDPLAQAYVTIGTETLTTDANGAFSSTQTGPVTVTSELRGPWFVVNNDAGTNAVVTAEANDGDNLQILHNEIEFELDMAQSVAFRDANAVRNFTLSVNPDYPTIGTESQFPVNVNLADTCNAYYDYSSINFFQAGGGCNNTAFGHVVYHEYGHHLVSEADSGQGEYGEGMADCIALLMTNDTVMAPGFFAGNCVSGIRNADNSCQYSATSCSTCGGGVHSCGQLISGCVWDTWEALRASHPLSADDVIRDLTINSILLHTGTAIDEAIAIDFVTLDDDDGDISNGSPHYNAIAIGFGAHGIDVPPIAWLDVSFPDGLPTHVAPDGSTTLSVEIADLLGAYQPDTAKLMVRVDSVTSIHPLSSLGGDSYLGYFPDTPCGQDVDYYLWIKTMENANVFVPAGAPDEAFTALSAWSDPELTWYDDSSTDTGWGVTGDATDGQWERGIPYGGNNRPQTDCDDTTGWCWLTDNATGQSDVDGGQTILTSARIDATNATHVGYCYWYRNKQNNGNGEDDSLDVQVSDDDGTSWRTLYQVGPTGPDTDGLWFTTQQSLASLSGFTPNDAFRIRFIAQDLGQTSRVEAAIDNIQITSVDCSKQPCPGDLDGDGQVGTNEILAVLDAWGDCQGCPADMTDDGVVNVNDLLFIVGVFGPCH
jgi:hypothetical protein